MKAARLASCHPTYAKGFALLRRTNSQPPGADQSSLTTDSIHCGCLEIVLESASGCPGLVGPRG